MLECKNCGLQNDNNATFCRMCGKELSCRINDSKNTVIKNQYSWYIFLKGISIIMVIYGVFAIVTLHSGIYNQEYTTNGVYNYVVTEHSDAIGLIKSIGYSGDMNRSKSHDEIIENSMSKGRTGYYRHCTALIIGGALIGGISIFINRRNKNQAR